MLSEWRRWPSWTFPAAACRLWPGATALMVRQISSIAHLRVSPDNHLVVRRFVRQWKVSQSHRVIIASDQIYRYALPWYFRFSSEISRL
jgi:hypothetical protein